MAALDIIASARSVLGDAEAIEAAGVFGVADNYAAIAAGGLATDVLDIASPVGQAVAGAAGIHAARQVNAQRQGLTARLMVIVTKDKILLYSLPSIGERPEHLLRSLPRESTTAEVKKFGLSRRLTLSAADGSVIKLSSSVSPLSRYAPSTKATLTALTSY